MTTILLTNKNGVRAFTPGPADEAVLTAFVQYPYLTSVQLCRLLYAYPGSLSYAQTRLKLLTDAAYLQRVFLPRMSRAGSAPSVYTLAQRGLRFLAAQGVTVPDRARPSLVREFTYLHLSHTLAVNEVLIGAALLCQRHPQLVLAQLLHERDLKRRPVRVPDGNGGTALVIPDGFLEFELHVGEGARVPLCLELDRGTEHQAHVRRKLRALVAFARGPYQDRFGRSALTICVLTTAGEKRLADLVKWTEAELTDLGQTADAGIFRFATFDLATATPEAIFLAPRWFTPFSRSPVPLLEGIL